MEDVICSGLVFKYLINIFAAYVYMAVFTFITMSMVPIVLDIVIPLNETRPKQLVYPALYPFDQDKYYSVVLAHGAITSFYNLTVLLSTESMLAVTTQHACGLFAIVG